jgi:hypothetical protein
MLDMNPNATVLHFDTLMSLATNKDGNIQKEKARALIRLFRPDREGNLTLLDFVRSCDRIYKRIKVSYYVHHFTCSTRAAGSSMYSNVT